MSDLYNVVVQGKALPGMDDDEVKNNLSAIFKEPPEKMAQLLSGKKVTVKKKVSKAQADKIALEINKAGADCEIVKHQKEIPDKLVMEEETGSDSYSDDDSPIEQIQPDTIDESRQMSGANPYAAPSSSLFEVGKGGTGATMKQRVVRINPLQLGKILAVVYALFSVVFIPFMIVPVLMSPAGSGPGMFFVIGLPVLYIVFGFIGGVIGAFVYNLSARWIGGIEIDIETF